jgi:hypothetical protein
MVDPAQGRARNHGKAGMSTSRHHADWLSLVEVSGPFLSLPVLLKAFPQGLDPRDAAQAKILRAAYEEWQVNPNAPGRQRAWLLQVLTGLLGYPTELIAEGQTLPPGLEANVAEMGEALRPNFALVSPKHSETAGRAHLLIATYPAEQALDRPVLGRHWKAHPATRMMELLHATGVDLGLITNGEHWMLVFAPRGETTGYASWYSTLWLDEPITLRAFHSLLGVQRFFGVASDSTLLGLLKESAQDQQEVTDQLGYQVRGAVEVLVQAFDTLDQDANRILLKGVAETVLYEAALTIMMRLVFLFSAEERGLLHLGKPLYDDNYAVSTLMEQLQEVADLHGPQVLERRYDAWARLLATFRAVHGGVQHQDLLMPAYGGSLFDPDRFPFLEGRGAGTKWTITHAEPLAVNNRVVLHLLSSLQRLRIKIPGGGPSEARRVSFRALGVEQIGHVYEGLLDHTAVRATEPVLGIKGTRDKEPEIPLTTMEARVAQGDEALIEFLRNETARSPSAIKRALNEGGSYGEHKLLIACGNDTNVVQRILPFAGLIREDSFERPMVVLPGSVYVTAGTTRRNTGTHYTPPSLTEPVVRYTLEPLVYIGPAVGLPRDQWQLKLPKEILDLKVCDMAMGSGAFLVQACRYLAERLMESWENEEKKHPGEVLVTPEGGFSAGSLNERLVPQDAFERLTIARRIVADRCIYGVDINPMAVEMAKLSLWLVTLDGKRPFTFLDQAFKCGDSLVGLSSFSQLENFSLRPEGVKQAAFSTMNLWRHVDEAQKKREALAAMPSDTHEQVATKAALYAEAEECVAKLRAAADVLLAVELKGLSDRDYEAEREAAADRMMFHWTRGLAELRCYAEECLGGHRTLHWPLAFPEIVEKGGFHAFVGNPPYLGGKKITTRFGVPFRDFIIRNIASGTKGHADLCAYFVLRADQLSHAGAYSGFVVSSAIAEADTREVGLDRLIDSGRSVHQAITNRAWPGTAKVVYSAIWLSHSRWRGSFVLNDKEVKGITSYLSDRRISARPHGLIGNSDLSFLGSYVGGTGFVITPAEAQNLIANDRRNSDVIFPYLTGADVNSSPRHSAQAWIINFFDWPLNKDQAPRHYSGPVAADFPECLAIIEERVKPERTRLNSNGEYVLRKPLPQKWWIYGDKRPALYSKLRSLKWSMAIAKQATKYVEFGVVTNNNVFSHALAIIASDSFGLYALLTSSFHKIWVREYCSYNLALLRYSPSDVFDTFPLSPSSATADLVGEAYHEHLRQVMISRNEGLTVTYNRFHEPSEITPDIQKLRELHTDLDYVIARAYGWNEIDLSHSFHETQQGLRYTISEVTRLEVLDRLLALNHRRHAEEEAEKVRLGDQRQTRTDRGRKPKADAVQSIPALFDLTGGYE